MIGSTVSVAILVLEFTFSLLAVLTQRAALRTKKDEIAHAIAWAVEVLVSVGSFFLLALFSTTTIAMAGFVLGIMIIVVGTIMLYNHISS